AARPEHHLDQNKAHDAGRCIRGVAHEISFDLFLSSGKPGVGESNDASIIPCDRYRVARYVIVAEGTQRKRFLPCLLLSEPFVGDGAQLGKKGWYVGWLNDLEPVSVVRDPAPYASKILSAGSFQRKVRERDACLLAQLDDVEAMIEIQIQECRSNLVEYRPAPVLVCKLYERSNELCRVGGRADGIAERDPATPVHTEHDEPGALLIEQERLVAQKCELRGRLWIVRNDRARVAQICLGRARSWLACGTHQTHGREYDQRGENTSARA